MGIQDYTIEERELLNEYLEPYLKPYYENDCKKLNKLVDSVLKKLKFYEVCKEDFCSLADEIITKAIYDYDFVQDFDGYIYSCLEKKFKTEMTRLNRYKRKNIIRVEKKDDIGNVILDKNNQPVMEEIIIQDESLYSFIGEEDGLTYEDVISGTFNVEKELFGENNNKSLKIEKYLDKLSKTQRKIVELLAASYKANEIQQILHIDKKQYSNEMIGIHSYENISILF